MSKSLTILAVTSLSPNSHAEAIRRTAAALPFDCEQVLISPRMPDEFNGRWVTIPDRMPNGTWEIKDVCDFYLYGLVGHVNTDAVIVVQWDGYGINPAKWTDAFLDYDYIGAPWPKAWCVHGNGRVGNAGFSLQSRKWLEASATLPYPPPELERGIDAYQCQKQLSHFEERGCVVAPLDVAMRWSMESRIEEYPKWSIDDSFGFHGLSDGRNHLRLTRDERTAQAA